MHYTVYTVHARTTQYTVHTVVYRVDNTVVLSTVSGIFKT